MLSKGRSGGSVQKVRRYRAGQVPTFAKDDVSAKDAALQRSMQPSLPYDHRRHRKEQQAQTQEESSSDESDTAAVRRPIAAQVVVQHELPSESDSESESESESEEDEAALLARRARLRALAAASGSEGEQEVAEVRPRPAVRADLALRPEPGSESEAESESESESEESSESEEEEEALRPVFTSKSRRSTIKAEALLQAEEEQRLAAEAQRSEERAKETREIVAEEIRRTVADEQEEEEVDDADDGDADEQFAAWKERELARLRRYLAESRRVEDEARETARRRKMTDAELMAEEPERFVRERGERRPMQRYYHRGAFFQDEDGYAAQVDVSAPTGEDKLNKEVLPDIMRVRKFGMAGRTKYTGLKDQDTTDTTFAWGGEPANKRQRRR